MCLLVHSFLHWIVQLRLLAIVHWNVRLVARGSRTTLPWVYDMMGRVVVHTYLANTLPCPFLLSVAANCSSTVTTGQPARKTSWPTTFLVFQQPKVVGKCLERPKVVSHPPTGFPRWSFIFLELGAEFWEQLITEANRGTALDFQTRRPGLHAFLSLWGTWFDTFLSYPAKIASLRFGLYS